MTSKSESLKKAAQLALLTKRLPSEILQLDEESIVLFELDYQLLMRELQGEDETEQKRQKMMELLKRKQS